MASTAAGHAAHTHGPAAGHAARGHASHHATGDHSGAAVVAAAAAATTPVAALAGRKRKSPAGAAAAAGAEPAASTVAAGAAPLAALPTNTGGIELTKETEAMTVEEYLRHHLARMIEKAEAVVDDAMDEVSHTYKMAREELQGYRHIKRAELAAKNKAARKKVWDVELTVTETAEANADDVGKVFVVAPRQLRDKGGMCKIGRSTGDEFKGTRGVSLSKDPSVSTWHGKLTSVWGTIYYTDLNTKNGTRHNGVRIAKDTPIALKNGDTITVGDTTLRVQLVPAMLVAEDDAAPAAAAAAVAVAL